MVENMSIFIPRYLKVLRAAGNIRQSDLALVSGVSKATVVNVEKGRCTSQSTMMAIFAGLVFGCKNKRTMCSLFRKLWKMEFNQDLDLDI